MSLRWCLCRSKAIPWQTDVWTKWPTWCRRYCQINFRNQIFVCFEFSVNFVPKGQINSKLAWVQVMAQCRTGDKPSFELMMTQFVDLHRADSRLAPSQWETSLQSNAVSHWLGANLESALAYIRYHIFTNNSIYLQYFQDFHHDVTTWKRLSE